jgi:hypothetical protein
MTNGGEAGHVAGGERPRTDGGATSAKNVKKERVKANCRVVVGTDRWKERVIGRERERTQGGVVRGINVEKERKMANCRVVVGSGGRAQDSEKVIKRERAITHGGVAVGDNVTSEREITNGSVETAIIVSKERRSANCRVGVATGAGAHVISYERALTNSSIGTPEEVV